MFHSNDIAEKVNQLALREKNIQERLDEVSHDIKTLEDKLVDIAVGFPASVFIGKHGEFTDIEKSRVKQLGWSANSWIEETLHWKRCASSQRFRLIYERIHELDYASAGEWHHYDIKVEPFFRPLIETPVEIRMRVYRKIPSLLDRISELSD